MKRFFINLMPGFLIRFFARPYVSGDSIEKGVVKADELWDKGISSTLDLLGEEVFSKEEVEDNVETYIELLKQLDGKNFSSISLKPSGLGIHESIEYCQENLEKILSYAEQVKIPVTLDMEDHTFTDQTLQLYKNLLPKYPSFGTVLQSRLFRTDNDIEGLSKIKARIRICIGIYNESKEIAVTKKSDMKDKLVEQVKTLMHDGHYVEVATHDKNTLQEILDLAKQNNWSQDQIEFQQLMGVPMTKLQNEILENYIVRLYVPFATHWNTALPYLRRRMVNNPSMGIYVIKNLFRR
ncbi:MAG: proline dehydrogenase family protein [Candidatus Kariarchaeaceae archaeon]